MQSFVSMVAASSYADFCSSVVREAKGLFLSNGVKIVFVRRNRLLCYNEERR